MKTIFILAMFALSMQAQGQSNADVERVTFRVLLPIHSLECTINLYREGSIESRTFSRLPDHYLQPGANTAIELNHGALTGSSCDLPTLEQLIVDAKERFGHVDAEVTVVKTTAKIPLVVNGNCVRDYSESLIVKLGRGVVVESAPKFSTKQATGCRIPW